MARERLLLQRASEPYRAAGKFAYYFARGKLSGDPAFVELLERGWLSNSRHILDLGCGQGLLFAWLAAARDSFERGDWPDGWPAPPRFERLVGIELMAAETRRAREAFGHVAEFVQADLRDASLVPVDTIVMLDVLHYLEPDAQERLLARMRAALPPGGLLLLRIGDASAGLPFRVSRWVDWLVLLARGHPSVRMHCRSVDEWRRVLARAGFRSEAVPLSRGTPFANVLLNARAE
ncbi:MAG: class I SAM-dependent methyltransferase [Steroidobacteraceae bacterium]